MTDISKKELEGSVARETLRQRAVELARPDREEREGSIIEILQFRCAGGVYGFEPDCLHEVHVIDRWTPLPGTPDFVVGLLNVRGQIWSLLDLRVLLGFPAGDADQFTQAILLSSPTMACAVAAEAVDGLVRIETDALAPAPSALGERARQFVRGIHANGMVVLNARKLLDDPELVVDQ